MRDYLVEHHAAEVELIESGGGVFEITVDGYAPLIGGEAVLCEGAVVGTSSLRRKAQLLYRRPDLKVVEFRGNVQTRLGKLRDGVAEATFLAMAGLTRLGMLDEVPHGAIGPDDMLPALAQGAIGIECRAEDEAVLQCIQPLHHHETGLCLAAERAVNARLEGSCQVPLAGYAELSGEQLSIKALLGSPDGKQILRAQSRGEADQGAHLGLAVAEELLRNGGDQILASLALDHAES